MQLCQFRKRVLLHFLYENTDLLLVHLQYNLLFSRYKAKHVFRKLGVFGPNAAELTCFDKYQRQKWWILFVCSPVDGNKLFKSKQHRCLLFVPLKMGTKNYRRWNVFFVPLKMGTKFYRRWNVFFCSPKNGNKPVVNLSCALWFTF